MVGAGPSIDAYLPEIVKFRAELTVFAVDAALPILNDYNIIPDFAVTIDAQKHCAVFFENLCSHSFILIFSPYAEPSILKKHKGEKYYIYSYPHHILEKFENELQLELDKNSRLAGGASVSTYCLDLIDFLGFEKIIIAGQDFGFTSNLIYSKRSYYYKKLLKNLNKFNTLETDFFNALINLSADKFCGVYTLMNLKNYLFEFEKYIVGKKNTLFYHLSADGIKIKNTIPLIKLSDFKMT